MMKSKTTTVLKKVMDEIKTGTFEIEKDVGLCRLHSIKVSTKRDYATKYNSKAYAINVSVTHPYFKDISFSFDYTPKDGMSHNFKNAQKDGFCQGTKPSGELKDVVLASLTHESYAFQISLKRTTWVHAENHPDDGTYLLWHIQYYGKYSPRSKWRLPKKCEKEQMWRTYDCNVCEGSRCPHVQLKCKLCKNEAVSVCSICKSPHCLNHSHCENGHNILTPAGMYEGKCTRCGRKALLGHTPCELCGNERFSSF